MDILMLLAKAVVITFAIYGFISFIFNVIENRSITRIGPSQPQSKEQVDLNPMEYPTSAYTDPMPTAIPPSYPPRSQEDMELS